MAKKNEEVQPAAPESLPAAAAPESAPANESEVSEASEKETETKVAFPADLTETLPEGWEHENDTVKVGNVRFEIRYPQVRTFAALLKHAENIAGEANKDREENEAEATSETIILSWFNRLQATGAKGGVNAINDAVKAKNDKDIAETIAAKQKNALSYFLGIMRGGRKSSGGLTQKRAQEFGQRVAMEMAKAKGLVSTDRLREIAAEMDLDFDAILAAQA